MLINLSPKSSFRTEMERHVKMFNRFDRDFKIEKFKFNDLFLPTEVKGIYFSDCGNEYTINCWAKQRAIYMMKLFNYETNIYSYGVADNIQQIVDYYNNGIMEGKFKGNHVILLKKVIKNPDNPCSGWRWHKWGQYIGIQNRCCEYINDEPDVTEVLCYRIYKVV